MLQKLFVRASQEMHDRENMSAIVAEFDEVQDQLESAFEKIAGSVGTYSVQAGSSIQSQIDAAVADGFGVGNPCLINIEPGTYTENLTLYAGIHLASMIRQKSYATVVSGTIGFSAASAGAAAANMVLLTGISVSADGSAPTFLFSGTHPQIVRFYNGEINAGGGGQPPLSMTNTGSGSTFIMDNSNLNVGAGAANAAAVAAGKLSIARGQANSNAAGNVALLSTGGEFEVSNSAVVGGVTLAAGTSLFLYVLINSSLTPVFAGAGNLMAGSVSVAGGGSGIAGGITQIPLVEIDT